LTCLEQKVVENLAICVRFAAERSLGSRGVPAFIQDEREKNRRWFCLPVAVRGARRVWVAIYVDSNGDGKLEPGTDALLGYGTLNPDGTWTLTISTPGWVPGSYTLFAEATDSLGAIGDPLALTLTVL